mgnify:CR=1 FL=1
MSISQSLCVRIENVCQFQNLIRFAGGQYYDLAGDAEVLPLFERALKMKARGSCFSSRALIKCYFWFTSIMMVVIAIASVNSGYVGQFIPALAPAQLKKTSQHVAKRVTESSQHVAKVVADGSQDVLKRVTESLTSEPEQVQPEPEPVRGKKKK